MAGKHSAITAVSESHMKVSGGLWLVLGLASSQSLGVGLVLRAAMLMGHMGSWFPHTRLGLCVCGGGGGKTIYRSRNTVY